MKCAMYTCAAHRLSAPGGRAPGGGGGGGAPPSAAAMLWMSNPGIPPNPAPIAAAAPGAPYRWLAIADIAVGLEKSACRGFAAAPGKPPGTPAGTVPGTASPKFSVSRFAAFAPSPPSSPASFFPRARLRLAGPDGSSPPASAARLARSNSASATSCSFSLATFALGLGFGFGRAPFLPSEAFGSGRFKTARKRRAGGTRVTRRGRRRSERRDAAPKEKEAKKRKRRRFPKDTRNPRRMKHVASTVGNRPENLDWRDSRWRKSGERRLAGNRASEGNPRAGRADARMPRSMLSAPYLFLPSSAPKAPARSSRLGSAGRS